MRTWSQRSTPRWIWFVAFVFLTALSVLSMHALDHATAHRPLGASDMRDDRGDGETDHGTAGTRTVASVASAACAFVVLVPVTGAIDRYSGPPLSCFTGERGASQVSQGPEPPVPRVLLES